MWGGEPGPSHRFALLVFIVFFVGRLCCGPPPTPRPPHP